MQFFRLRRSGERLVSGLSEYFTEVTVIKHKLTAREKEFCLCFAQTGDAANAAREAGYAGAERTGRRLLCEERICAELERLAALRLRLLGMMAATGYQRLAFGSAADAVSLVYEQEPDRERLEKMDLFLISEIKRPKDGAMEIKLFDRVKALEKLENMSAANGAADSLFDAIGRSAAGCDGDD